MTEEVFNVALGRALKAALPEWRDAVLIEQTRTLREAPGRHPDILVAHHTIPPVAVEVSFQTGDADADAVARLGLHYSGNGREIQTAIAVEQPKGDVDMSSIPTSHPIRYALHQNGHRFPRSGFVRGDVHDLARLIAATAVPKEEMEAVAGRVAADVAAAANVLEPVVKSRDLLKISKALYQRSSMTGLRTTMVLWLNALLVQQRLRGGTHDVPPVSHVPSKCLDAWRSIYGINWKAIFKPAIEILDRTRSISPSEVSEALKLLTDAVERIETARLGSDISIGAELFPKMAEDRKESAAFYTQPATAELLAALTITPDMRRDWSDGALFERFHIADVTCGTGTLLQFGYRQVKAYHRRAEHTAESVLRLHRSAMERGLIGTDVSPIAAHLTSAGLAVDTDQPYGDPNIGWVGVGNENRTGAIEYMAKSAIEDLLMDTVGRSSGQGTGDNYNSVTVRDNSVDVVLMNPPYSRTRVGQSAFDIAGLTEKERKACQARWAKLIKGEPCLKTAGMAATFLCVARKKVKPGGRIGFVLPRTAAFANSWERTRGMVERDFEDITAVAVSSGKALGRAAFSADTNMEEMLLTAARKRTADATHSPVKCVTLYEPVTRLGEAAEVARAISGAGEGPVVLGDEIGVSRTFRSEGGRPWSYVGVVHDDVAVISISLADGELLDLEGEAAATIQMARLEDLFAVGPTHHLIGHIPDSRYPTGAFTIHDVVNAADAIGKYRSLWNVDSKRQTRMVVSPTKKCAVYDRAKADRVWKSRSTLFYCRKVSWTSQVVAATTERPAMGGNMWISLQHADRRVLKAFALWANSTYGMLVYWSKGSRTHPGRSMLEVRAIRKVPCPRLDMLDGRALDRAAADFDRLSGLDLRPMYRADRDAVRAGIDDAVSAMLGVPDYDTDALARAWCAEPSVRGRK